MPKGIEYEPFYPTTLGIKLHDKTLQQLPAYSLRAKIDTKPKFYSPGPGTYPRDDGKKRYGIPKPLYPEDKAVWQAKEMVKQLTPSPATYPLQRKQIKGAKNEILSIYPKDNANKFSIGKRRDEKVLPKSPGPAIYPREKNATNNITTLLPIDNANKFTMRPKFNIKNTHTSPGLAGYPCMKKEDKNKVMSIYPADTTLLPTIKQRFEHKDKKQVPAPNRYPQLKEKSDGKKGTADLIQKMIPGKRSPMYSLGVKHSPKQHMLISKSDDY